MRRRHNYYTNYFSQFSYADEISHKNGKKLTKTLDRWWQSVTHTATVVSAGENGRRLLQNQMLKACVLLAPAPYILDVMMAQRRFNSRPTSGHWPGIKPSLLQLHDVDVNHVTWWRQPHALSRSTPTLVHLALLHIIISGDDKAHTIKIKWMNGALGNLYEHTYWTGSGGHS